MPRVAAGVLVLVGGSSAWAATALTGATWNSEHLRDEVGEGPNPRTEADSARLRHYAEVLDAEVVGLQELETVVVAEQGAALHTGFAGRRGLPLVCHPGLFDHCAVLVTLEVP